MTAALAWLANEWPQVRPNLEASVLWVPVSIVGTALAHHFLALRRDRHRQAWTRQCFDALHGRLDELHRRIGPATTETAAGSANVPPAGLTDM